MNQYLPRIADRELDELLPSLPAVALEGPKGVGKTETALRRAQTVRQLDDPVQREVAEADPVRFLSGPKPLLVDEWQRVPALWDAVRRAVDAGAAPGSFLLTGSASPATAPTHSGAGRIVSLRLRPLTLSERGLDTPTVSLASLLTGTQPPVEGATRIGLADYVHELVRSGLPGLRGYAGRALRSQLDGYLRRLIDTDFTEQGHPVRRPEALQRWLAAYAAATAGTASWETIRDAATGGQNDKPSRSATQPYRDVLERLWILDPVPAWLPGHNQLNRLSQPAKHHLADPALAVCLLGLDADALLAGREAGPPVPRDGSLLGLLFESLVTLCVRVCAQAAEAHVKHFRQLGGRREVDLIVERADQRILALEVKLGATVEDEDVRHLNWLRGQLGGELLDAAIIHTGPEAYRRKDGIAVIPAALLGP
jgi:predicted AAA+ superfamily ATPase